MQRHSLGPEANANQQRLQPLRAYLPRPGWVPAAPVYPGSGLPNPAFAHVGNYLLVPGYVVVAPLPLLAPPLISTSGLTAYGYLPVPQPSPSAPYLQPRVARRSFTQVRARQLNVPHTWENLDCRLNEFPIGITLKALSQFVNRPPGSTATLDILDRLSRRLPELVQETEKVAVHEIDSDIFMAFSEGFRHYNHHRGVTDDTIGNLTKGVTHWLQHRSLKLSSQAISTLLFNLQHLRDVPATPAMLKALTRHIECAQQFNAPQISRALFGLRRIGESPQALGVLAALATHVERLKQCAYPLTPMAIGNALQGLSSMTSKPEVQRILAAFTPHIREVRKFEVQYLNKTFQGLQGLVNSVEAEELLSALAPHIERLPTIDARIFHSALCGLQCMDDSPACKKIVKALQQRLINVDKKVFTDSFTDLRMLQLCLPEAIHNLRRRLNTDEAVQLVHTLAELLDYPHKPSRDILADPWSRQEWLLQMTLNKPHSPNDKNFSVDEIDLHGYSHSLAEGICRHGFRIFKHQPSPDTLIIIFGNSRHKAGNAQKMQAIVAQVVASFHGEVQWQAGRVVLSRTLTYPLPQGQKPG